jgi:membrane protein YqaA with SNARE-associated domain
LWAAREVDPISVAVIGSVGTCIANLHDYYIIDFLFRKEKIKKAKQTKFYRNSVAWFARAPFATLTAASFLPIPIDVVRILAVSAGYPRRCYALATFVGRLPRYLLLAYFGYELQPSNKAIFVVFLATATFGIVKGISKLRDRGSDGNAAAAERGA